MPERPDLCASQQIMLQLRSKQSLLHFLQSCEYRYGKHGLAALEPDRLPLHLVATKGWETIMATTATESDLVLHAPAPVRTVTPEKAAGLVPLQPEQKSQLDAKAEAFVEELAGFDANSPEF